MTECQYFEVTPTRTISPATFPLGVIEFPFSVGVPNVWNPSKSYFRVSMTLYGGGGGPTQPQLSEMVAFADNAAGNLFDNAYLRSNNVEISSIKTGLVQASALNARLTNAHGWLKSIGAGADLNESAFIKRNQFTASDSKGDAYLGAANEMYRPVTAATYSTAEIAITSIAAANQVTFGVVDFTTAVSDPVVGAPLIVGSVATCATGLFTTGMPNPTTGAPTGGPVLPGDVLVVAGVYYPIVTVTNATTLGIAYVIPDDIDDTADWYIIRKDAIRAPQANNTVYTIWQPPMGIFGYDGVLGSGEFRLVLNPNSNYLLAAAETRNPSYAASATGLTGTYSVQINDVKFYAHMAKVKIPDQVQDLTLLEYQVQSKPWQSNLQFTISPYTRGIAIFVQDMTSGQSPLIPPSMFKVSDNSDLMLQSLQVSYGGVTKPSTPWLSNFYNGADQLQQRYNDTYEEAGGLAKVAGNETYYDFLQRGPYYYMTFERDMTNRATEVQVNTFFNGLPNGPGSGGTTGLARVFCVSYFQRMLQLTTAAGSLVQVVASPS